MREGIHPNYVEATVTCACGFSFKTRSTKPVIRLDICSSCHPFFSGKQKFVDTAGRVERFQKRFAKTGGETVKKTLKPIMAKGQKAALDKKKAKVMRSAPIVIPKKPGSERIFGKAAAEKAAAKPATKETAPAKTH